MTVATETGSEVETEMEVTEVETVMAVTEVRAVGEETPMPDVTVAIRTVILPGTARRRRRDVTDAISQDIWLRIVKMKLKVVQTELKVLGSKDHATTVERPVICNVTAHRPPPRTATSARRPDIWPVTAPPRSARTTDRSPTMVMTELATTVANLDTSHGTARNRV